MHETFNISTTLVSIFLKQTNEILCKTLLLSCINDFGLQNCILLIVIKSNCYLEQSDEQFYDYHS